MRVSLGAAVAACLLLAACGSSGNGAGSNTLVFGRNRDAVKLDPAVAVDGMSLDIAVSTMEGLVRYRPGSFAVEPDLAQSWSVDSSGKHWIFVLRKGVKFQDGTTFDAPAVKFNFDRWGHTANAYHTGGDYTYYESQFGGFPGVIADVRVLDAGRVEIDLTKPVAPLLADLAMPAFTFSSPTAIQTEGEGYPQQPIGTGPYQVTEWAHDDHITLKAFAGYWGAKPAISTIVIKDIPTADSSLLSLEKGEIDGWEYPTPESLPQIEKDPRLKVYHLPANNTMYLAMNELKHPFDDVRVRRAINMAIDAEALVRNFYSPGAFVADEMLPPAVWPQGVKDSYPYDPAAARKLLAQAGYPNGFSTTLWFPTTPRPYLPEPERVAEAVQADLRAIGINAKLEGLEWGNYLYGLQDGQHNLALYGWTGDNGDPDNFLYVMLDKDSANPPGAQNICFWKDDDFHRLMLAAQVTDDVARRAALYRQALVVLRDQAPLVPLVHNAPPTVFAASIAGFVPRPDSFEDFASLRFAPGSR
ncbi:MAG TPA: ABC transporter substrate-binding protein [Candidatus Eremiobacteraceae bacterium]|nr:ABC transporter substrate-binding protein [Candidatus Eremiobacteraceae bacterium]